MLDEFIEEQKVIHKIIKNVILKNKLSHAYIIEGNNYEKKEELALAFAKYLLCPFNYSNNNKCVDCTQCQNIDKRLFNELKVINPNGMWIKKEQILDLQKEFKLKSLLANKKVYIINEVEKLNESASNSLLKFLEEPNDNIIAILVADNIHQLLPTIISRCQILSLKKNQKEINSLINQLSVKIEDIERMKTIMFKFVNELEDQKEKTLLYTKKLILNEIPEKNDLIALFELMIYYYQDILKYKFGKQSLNFDLKDIEKIANNNNLEQLNKKIAILLNLKSKIYVNANTNLLIDKLILEIGGKYEYCRNSV